MARICGFRDLPMLQRTKQVQTIGIFLVLMLVQVCCSRFLERTCLLNVRIDRISSACPIFCCKGILDRKERYLGARDNPTGHPDWKLPLDTCRLSGRVLQKVSLQSLGLSTQDISYHFMRGSRSSLPHLDYISWGSYISSGPSRKVFGRRDLLQNSSI